MIYCVCRPHASIHGAMLNTAPSPAQHCTIINCLLRRQRCVCVILSLKITYTCTLPLSLVNALSPQHIHIHIMRLPQGHTQSPTTLHRTAECHALDALNYTNRVSRAIGQLSNRVITRLVSHAKRKFVYLPKIWSLKTWPGQCGEGRKTNQIPKVQWAPAAVASRADKPSIYSRASITENNSYRKDID